MLGLRFCARAFSSCGKRGPLFIAAHGPLTIAACLVAEHRIQTCRLSSCGSRVQLLRGMWDLPRPGLEPVSPALAGRFSTTVPPGKPRTNYFIKRNNTTYYNFDQKGGGNMSFLLITVLSNKTKYHYTVFPIHLYAFLIQTCHFSLQLKCSVAEDSDL